MACVILATVHLYKEHGRPMQEEGRVVAVLHRDSTGWHMRGCTWSDIPPRAAKQP